MIKKFLLVSLLSVTLGAATSRSQSKQETAPLKMTPEMTEQWEPVTKIVTPGSIQPDGMVAAPSDAIVLFDGSGLSEWRAAPDSDILIPGKDMSKFKSSAGKQASWSVKDGILTINKEAGDLQTKREFADFQLHIEWRIPKDIQGYGQLRGNSGVFLQGHYELQILDSYKNKTYVNGQAASIYKQTPPLVNAMREPGEWNTYDIIYQAPTFNKDSTAYRTKPSVTVLQNGILVQDHTAISGVTRFIGLPEFIYHGKGPIRLQAHGDDSKSISFRNIWIREL